MHAGDFVLYPLK